MISATIRINDKIIGTYAAVRKNPTDRIPERGELCTYLTKGGDMIEHPYGDAVGLVVKILETYLGVKHNRFYEILGEKKPRRKRKK